MALNDWSNHVLEYFDKPKEPEAILPEEKEPRKIKEKTKEYRKIGKETLLNLQYLYGVQLSETQKKIRNEASDLRIKNIFGQEFGEMEDEPENRLRKILKMHSAKIVPEDQLIINNILEFLTNYQNHKNGVLTNEMMAWLIIHYLYIMDYKTYAYSLNETAKEKYPDFWNSIETPLSSNIIFIDDMLGKNGWIRGG